MGVSARKIILFHDIELSNYFPNMMYFYPSLKMIRMDYLRPLLSITIALSKNWHTVKEVNKRKLEFVSALCSRIIQYNELNYFKSMAIYF